ncbi:MAG: transglutaminase-like domain-containing protein [Pseudomonadota bacterium]
MSTFELSYRTELPAGTEHVIAPGGMATPRGSMTGFQVDGGTAVEIQEASTGQTAYRIAPTGGVLRLTWRFDGAVTAPYPQTMFTPRDTPFTRSAADLVAEAQVDAGDLRGLDRARAIACATAERFTYGHPTARFNDGFDHVPALGCGLTEGSCVDINTYFIAALRAVGIEAGYVTGFFFPEDKGDHCEDGHCWVVTRINGETQEWDIAHHLNMGTRDIQPGLNPKPGFRAATFHSMGLAFPALGLSNVKALIEPFALMDEGYQPFATPEIRLSSTSKASDAPMQASAV